MFECVSCGKVIEKALTKDNPCAVCGSVFSRIYDESVQKYTKSMPVKESGDDYTPEELMQ